MNWACENLGPLTTACNEPARNCKTKTVMTKQNLIQVCLLSAALLQAATSGAQPVTKIAGGGSQSFFLKSGGSLWAMGLNDFGQLGNGTLNPTNWPEKVLGTNVTTIAAGIDHTLFLKSDGSLWAMGRNSDGQLGDGTTDGDNYYTNRPEKIVASGVTAIAAGGYHSLFLKSDSSPLILALFSDFVKKVRWEGLFRLSNTYRFSIGVFHVCALAFAAQDALRFG